MAAEAAAVPRVDIGALAGALFNEAAHRMAQVVVVGPRWLDDDGNHLNETQQVELARAAFTLTEGLERTFLMEIQRHLARAGIETWGEDESTWAAPEARKLVVDNSTDGDDG